MFNVRLSQDRGHFDHGWLKTYHTFSFADYHDPKYNGFRSLRVINEDKVQGGNGFDMHPHRDVEVITYILEGALAHQDSLGQSGTIKAGEVQKISAGTGISHSEYNASETDPVHLLQIWILPNQRGVKPSYTQAAFTQEEKRDKWCLILSPKGKDGSLPVYQDALLWATRLSQGKGLTYSLVPARYAWIQVASGEVIVDGHLLKAGDGAAVTNETGENMVLNLSAQKDSELLLFDLA